MKAKQNVVSVKEFAEAMRGADGLFDKRVQGFEKQFGKADADTLGVLAQANYFCRYNAEYEKNLTQVCRAICAGKPTSFYCHCQLTPERWVDINTYVVAVQRWLGIDLLVPVEVNSSKVAEIAAWLGRRHPAREALAELFLCQLCGYLWESCLAQLTEEAGKDGAQYADFYQWYFGRDGTPYVNGSSEERVEEFRHRAQQAMEARPRRAKELIEGILSPSQPPCMHRFSRYLDIHLASIGALKWRGGSPQNEGEKERWQEFWEDADAAFEAWLDGSPPSSELGRAIHDAIGEATDRAKAVVRDFLLVAPGDSAFAAWRWLTETARERGFTAQAAFGRNGNGP